MKRKEKPRAERDRDERDPGEREDERNGERRGQRILERVLLFQRSPKGESIGFSAGSHGDREANRTIHTISDEDVERASYHPSLPPSLRTSSFSCLNFKETFTIPLIPILFCYSRSNFEIFDHFIDRYRNAIESPLFVIDLEFRYYNFVEELSKYQILYVRCEELRYFAIPV